MKCGALVLAILVWGVTAHADTCSRLDLTYKLALFDFAKAAKKTTGLTDNGEFAKKCSVALTYADFVEHTMRLQVEENCGTKEEQQEMKASAYGFSTRTKKMREICGKAWTRWYTEKLEEWNTNH